MSDTGTPTPECAKCSQEATILKIDDTVTNISKALVTGLDGKTGLVGRVGDAEGDIKELKQEIWGNGKPGLKERVTANEAAVVALKESVSAKAADNGSIVLTPRMMLACVACLGALCVAGPTGFKAVLLAFGIKLP
jgi:hypothetical protein